MDGEQVQVTADPNSKIITECVHAFVLAYLLASIRSSTFEAIANPQYDLLGKLKQKSYQFGKLPRPGDPRGYPPNGLIFTTG